MSVHQQYNLVFTKIITREGSIWPSCDVNQTGVLPPLQSELSAFISRSSGKGGGLVVIVLENINQILTHTWRGFVEEGDNVFLTETGEVITLSLTDGYAYLGEEDIGWPELPKIPLTDLKAIFEEWNTFKRTIYGE